METPAFLIDDLAAPGMGEDTRHLPVPGKLSARRVEGFVGDAARYVIKGVTRPKSWIITGPLLGADFAALYGHIATYEAMQADILPHKLTIHGTDYEEADLVSFRLRGTPHGYRSRDMAPPAVGARGEVEMLWELLG